MSDIRLDKPHDGRPMSHVCNLVLIGGDGDDDNDNNDELFAEPQYRMMACVKYRKCRLFFSYGNDLPLVQSDTKKRELLKNQQKLKKSIERN